MGFQKGNGNFENSNMLEGLVILNQRKRKSQTGKKSASHHRIFFSPLPDVLMLMTDFLHDTTLNHCLWFGMEDNRCGRHVVNLQPRVLLQAWYESGGRILAHSDWHQSIRHR